MIPRGVTDGKAYRYAEASLSSWLTVPCDMHFYREAKGSKNFAVVIEEYR